MNADSTIIQLSRMVRAARFFSREEAEALAEVAREAGVIALVVENRRLPQGFDGSLGGFDAAEGVSVFLRPEDVAPLREALVQTMEVQPGDPLEGLSQKELEAIVRRPMQANLMEQALAAKILNARGTAVAAPEDAVTLMPRDPHAAADLRLARWIGGLAVVLPLLLIIISLSLANYGWEQAVFAPAYYVHTGLSGPLTPDDGFAAPLRIFLFVLAPLAAGAALRVSRRKTPGGATRWMFPPVWRRIGLGSLVVSLSFYVIPLIVWLYFWIRLQFQPETSE